MKAMTGTSSTLIKVCGLIPFLFYSTERFCSSSNLCFESCPTVAGVDLVEGDIQQDKVRSSASEH